MLAQRAHPFELVAIADPKLLAGRAELLNLPLTIGAFVPDRPAVPQTAGSIAILPVELAAPALCGQLNEANSRYVLKTITRAARGCLDGLFAAMVTGPVHKAIINAAGIAFTGHTEYIAGISGGQPVMMLATPGLRVALATTHLPLAEVSKAITHNRLRTVLRILHQELQTRMAIAEPKILVCGLNPHAGEGGHLGREEIEIIEPVLAGLRRQGVNLEGPLPADSVFTPDYLSRADAILAMYHDQGLPVLKHLGFGKAVNITLGLPLIRTSVDHGTALELAGTGKASPGSLEYALQTAAEMLGSSA